MSNRRRYYPAVQPDADGDGLVSHAGAVALVETARAAGLDRGLARALSPWRKPTAVHDPGKIVLDLAVALAVGGTCLADIAVLREQAGVFGPVASDPTVSRAIDTLAADAPAALAAIAAARAAAHARVWAQAARLRRTLMSAPPGRWSSTSTPRWSPRTATSRTPSRHASAATASIRCGSSPITARTAAERRAGGAAAPG